MISKTVRAWLAIEIMIFGGAALLHGGVFLPTYAHRAAGTAETLLASVLLIGLVATGVVRESVRAIGLGVQAFALLGTIVGIVTIAIGIGPRTTFDVTLHATMVAVLVAGLISTARFPMPAPAQRP